VFEIGNSLREARVRQQIELSEAELATKIRARYLRALEEETFEVLPAQTYVKGFLRTYADYLGLDGQLYVDEFNSRFAEGEEPREPVVVRRSSNVRRQQHSGPERRWVIYALVGIAVVLAIVLGAWKFGAQSNENVPNFTPTTKPKSAILPPATATTKTKPKQPRFTLYLRAQHGNSWLEVRNWSQSGKALFTGTVELGGQDHRWVSRRLWVNFGSPANLGIVYNGHLVHVNHAGSYIFSPHGFTRAA
jgi:cytoskeleton protein RodZ